MKRTIKILFFMFIGLVIFITMCSVDIVSTGKEADNLFKAQKYKKAESKYLFVLKRTKEKEYLQNAKLKLSEIYYHYASTAYTHRTYNTALNNLDLSLKHDKTNKKAKALQKEIKNKKAILMEYAKVNLANIYALFIEGSDNIKQARKYEEKGDRDNSAAYFMRARKNFTAAQKLLRQNKKVPQEFRDVNPYPAFNAFASKSIEYITANASESEKLYDETFALAKETKDTYREVAKRVDAIMQ